MGCFVAEKAEPEAVVALLRWVWPRRPRRCCVTFRAAVGSRLLRRAGEERWKKEEEVDRNMEAASRRVRVIGWAMMEEGTVGARRSYG